MSGVIRWQDPPAKHGNHRRAASVYQNLADVLRARPGVWAVVMEGKTSGAAGGFAHRIRAGYGPFAPARSFDARCIGPADGSSSTVYARFVGEPS